MARSRSANGSVPRVAAVVPSDSQAKELQSQVDLLLRADSALSGIIGSDVDMGEVDSPFVHPLYQVRIKLDALRGKKAKKLALYARFQKKQAAEARKAAAAA